MNDLTDALDRWDAAYFDNKAGQIIDVQVLVAAARRVAEAPEVWWCETHRSRYLETEPTEWHPCLRAVYEDHYLDQGFEDCRMVRKLLVDPDNL